MFACIAVMDCLTKLYNANGSGLDNLLNDIISLFRSEGLTINIVNNQSETDVLNLLLLQRFSLIINRTTQVIAIPFILLNNCQYDKQNHLQETYERPLCSSGYRSKTKYGSHTTTAREKEMRELNF